MQKFFGFRRRAIVIVPKDADFEQRRAIVEKEEGKDIPDSVVMSMKGRY